MGLTRDRALAESWAGEGKGVGTFSNQLESISLFVLLDLLGSADPTVPSYFAKTHWAYEHMATAERRLRKLGLLETKEAKHFLPDLQKKSYQFTMGYVLDDHVPFLERGVDVLHVIPTPFPPVWHTMDDDGAHLDIPTIRDWAKIVTAFVAEWMELDGLLPSLGSDKSTKSHAEKEEL
jgi:glutaminyl-peptide cyclotransferase